MTNLAEKRLEEVICSNACSTKKTVDRSSFLFRFSGKVQRNSVPGRSKGTARRPGNRHVNIVNTALYTGKKGKKKHRELTYGSGVDLKHNLQKRHTNEFCSVMYWNLQHLQEMSIHDGHCTPRNAGWEAFFPTPQNEFCFGREMEWTHTQCSTCAATSKTTSSRSE